MPAVSIPACMFNVNLVIPTQICDELSCRQWKIYGQTDGQTQASTMSIRPERQGVKTQLIDLHNAWNMDLHNSIMDLRELIMDLQYIYKIMHLHNSNFWETWIDKWFSQLNDLRLIHRSPWNRFMHHESCGSQHRRLGHVASSPDDHGARFASSPRSWQQKPRDSNHITWPYWTMGAVYANTNTKTLSPSIYK